MYFPGTCGAVMLKVYEYRSPGDTSREVLSKICTDLQDSRLCLKIRSRGREGSAK